MRGGLPRWWCILFFSLGVGPGFLSSVTLGASQMTTKFLTIKFAKFPNFIVMEFPRKKTEFWTIFRKFSPLRNPLQNANFINIVVSASLTLLPCIGSVLICDLLQSLQHMAQGCSLPAQRSGMPCAPLPTFEPARLAMLAPPCRGLHLCHTPHRKPEIQECAEHGGTRCTGPTWTKLVPRRPTWTNLAKLVVVCCLLPA